ncbi:unannotated protein [freshwater metagenome]|uniref:Unannotated protein n=1 Tax=freshwater metagenome TaxID=449393 RepID=A0A6J6IU34_9ZZZZ
MLVVNNFLAYINRGTVVVKRLFNRNHGSVHAGTVSPRGGQKDATGRGIVDFGHTPSLREIISPP